MATTNKNNVSHLRSHIGYRLRVVSNAVSHGFAQRLDGCGVTVAEWVILREMYSSDEETSPSIVAKTTGLTRGAVSKLIERLLKKGLVTRNEGTEDRRYQNIKLTPKAVKLIPKLANLADENDKTFFSMLTASERAMLLAALAKIADAHRLNTSPID